MMRLLVCLALPAVTWACTCMSGAPPCEAAWKASAVFAGTVRTLTHDSNQPDSRGVIQANGYLGTHATFEVTEAFLGMEASVKSLRSAQAWEAGIAAMRSSPAKGMLFTRTKARMQGSGNEHLLPNRAGRKGSNRFGLLARLEASRAIRIRLWPG